MGPPPPRQGLFNDFFRDLFPVFSDIRYTVWLSLSKAIKTILVLRYYFLTLLIVQQIISDSLMSTKMTVCH